MSIFLFSVSTCGEIENYFNGGDIYAGRMDLWNNAAGRRAAGEGRESVPESWLVAIKDAPPGQQLPHQTVYVLVPILGIPVVVPVKTPW